jgi:hypothetical protein
MRCSAHGSKLSKAGKPPHGECCPNFAHSTIGDIWQNHIESKRWSDRSDRLGEDGLAGITDESATGIDEVTHPRFG